MSSNDSDYIVQPDGFHMDADGTLHYYFSDGLSEYEDQAQMLKWAEDVVNLEGQKENCVSIIVDISGGVEELLTLGFGYETFAGKYHVELVHKPAFDALRKQLESSLAMLDKIEYEGTLN